MTIPQEVKNIITKLQDTGFEAYIVGGCVRDFLMDKEPADWDVTTNAKPEEIQKVFPDSFYENNFLTVGVKTDIGIIEVTTYRLEAEYSDKRHPDKVQYAKTLEEDLSRRDFTVNAMAFDPEVWNMKHEAQKSKSFKFQVSSFKIVDPFGGQEDLKNKIIRTVGDANERFGEDALRMLRAVRFATTLGFKIEEKTAEAIKKNSVWIEAVSKERIRDELVKIIAAGNPADGMELLRELGLLKVILPELEANVGIGQNKHHIYDCYTHALKALEFTAKKKYSLNVRLAALFHDIAKPKVKVGDGINSTFYAHEIVGAKMAFQILNRLKFSNKDIQGVVNLVRHHMFYYNTDQVTESAVRRLVKKVGPENMTELLQLREADRIGSGVPKAEPYKLRHLKYIIEKVAKDPISVKMLKINGEDLMGLLGIKPGPKIGQILDVLLGHVLDDPKKNTKDFLEKEAKMLAVLSDAELKSLAEKSKEEKEEVQSKEDSVVKNKYWVK